MSPRLAARKLFAIARKDVFVAFSDRNAMLFMFAMPIFLSVIIGVTFGSGSDVTLDDVPVAVVNHDQGTTAPDGSTFNLGATFADAFVPSAEETPGDETSSSETNNNDFAAIHDLTDGKLVEEAAAARTQVEDGDLAAAILITNENFSANALENGDPSVIDLYTDSARSVGPSVVRSIVNAIANGMNTVILAQRTGPDLLTAWGQDMDAGAAAIGSAIGRFSGQTMDLAQAAPIQLEQQNLEGEPRTMDMLQYFAPSMAILFMTFAMATGGTNILKESRDWTLQRIITTPTPRWLFMGGKLTGIYATGVIQLILLIIATTLIAQLMGRDTAVWGTNLPGLALMILAVVFAATSLGLLIAALARSVEQASAYNNVVIFLLGMLGGSFIPIENLPDALSLLPKLTLNYWGIDGFFALAYKNAPIGAIAPNLLVLVVMGCVLFSISLWRFNRRLDI